MEEAGLQGAWQHTQKMLGLDASQPEGLLFRCMGIRMQLLYLRPVVSSRSEG